MPSESIENKNISWKKGEISTIRRDYDDISKESSDEEKQQKAEYSNVNASKSPLQQMNEFDNEETIELKIKHHLKQTLWQRIIVFIKKVFMRNKGRKK